MRGNIIANVMNFLDVKIYVGHQGYCFVCQIVNSCCVGDVEKIKDDLLKHFDFAKKLFDNKKCYELDKNLIFSCYDIENKWKDLSLGVYGRIYLKDCDYY